MAEPRAAVDAGNVVGNAYDKYGTSNPIARWLLDGFLHDIHELYATVDARSVLEVGCGEGHLAHALVQRGPRPERFVACDVDLSRRAADLDPQIELREASAYALPFADRSFELVVCCEVLEHLGDPATAIGEIARVSRRAVLVSTPWEPVWRLMNLARGRYVSAWGNTPGHIQHFSRRALRRLVSRRVDVLEERRPLPWTVLLGAPRR